MIPATAPTTAGIHRPEPKAPAHPPRSCIWAFISSSAVGSSNHVMTTNTFPRPLRISDVTSENRRASAARR